MSRRVAAPLAGEKTRREPCKHSKCAVMGQVIRHCTEGLLAVCTTPFVPPRLYHPVCTTGPLLRTYFRAVRRGAPARAHRSIGSHVLSIGRSGVRGPVP